MLPFSQVLGNPSTKLAPVILSVVDSQKFSKSLNFSAIKQFIQNLEVVAGKVTNVEVASGGDLFVSPVDQMQKDILLSLEKVGEVPVTCKRTNWVLWGPHFRIR